VVLNILPIIQAAVESEGASIDLVLSRDRHQTTSRARACAVWLTFKLHNVSFREIAKAFGLRSHFAVSSSIEAHERRMMADDQMRDRSMRIIERFEGQKRAA
jgi:chromosomal replication initiation ATPase DnaA